MKNKIDHFHPLGRFSIMLVLAITILNLHSCIGDDFVNDIREPELRIVSSIDSLELNSSFQLEVMYLNNVGESETITPMWTSTDASVISITDEGLAMANAFGEALLRVTYDDGNNILTDDLNLAVGMSTVGSSDEPSGTVTTTSSYKLSGEFILEESGSDIIMSFDDTYCASTALPGLYVYLSNNRNSIANALEIGEVEVFNGAHDYTIPDIGLKDYSFVVYFCKPFNVKVGDGEIQ